MITEGAHAVIEVNGESFDSWKNKSLFAGVEVELTTDEASQAAWRVLDPNFELLDKYISGDGIAVLGARVWLGFGGDLGEPVFKGLLARVERGGATTTFRFYDMGFRMRQVQKTEYHKGLDDVQIIEKLARRNGLMFDGPKPALKLDKHKSLMQDGQSDWEFAKERADESGVVLFVRGDTIFVREAAKTGAPIITLSYKKDFVMLNDFSLSLKVPENVAGRQKQVEHRGRGRGGHRLKGMSDTSARGTQRVEIKNDLAVKSKRHADRRAEAKKELQREHAFTLSVRMLSSFAGKRPDVRETVAITDLGKLFSGNYLCDRVAHEYRPGELSTSLDLYRDIKG
jgi:phage protein D